MVDAEFTADITQCPARRADQLNPVLAELLGVLQWTGHLDIIPQTSGWHRGEVGDPFVEPRDQGIAVPLPRRRLTVEELVGGDDLCLPAVDTTEVRDHISHLPPPHVWDPTV